MPEHRPYESHLSLEAARFVSALSRRQQITILDLAERIAEQPFRISDYQTSDSTGRPAENLLLGKYLFTYWVDHASREVRIVEIVAV